MTQVTYAKKNIVTKEMKTIAKQERKNVDFILEGLKKGWIVIPSNKQSKKVKLCGIGRGLKTKINANIGTSPDDVNLKKELKKLETAIKFGVDTVMDLSTGGDLRKIRQEIIKNSTVPVGTVPIYQAICELNRKGKDISSMTPDDLFSIIEEHCTDGVDFITVHCGVNRKNVEILKKIKRVCGIVSRGGAFHARWILSTGKENPLYEHFDRLLDIAYKYDVTLSLGDGLRPGAIADACDEAQISELKTISELVKIAREKEVQVIVEGPGHMPIDKIQEHVKLQKELTNGAPFYLLGPLVTDISAGFDHINSAIGAALAGSAGADFICYVTPAEHLGLPDVEDVYWGVMSAKIAAHAADISKNIKSSYDLDLIFSKARKKFDWKKQKQLSFDPDRFIKKYKESKSANTKVCTMCGSRYCAMRTSTIIGL